MNTSRILTLIAIAALPITVFAAPDSPPKKQPLGRYQELWAKSPFAGDFDVADAPNKKAQGDNALRKEIAELKARIKKLEAMVDELRKGAAAKEKAAPKPAEEGASDARIAWLKKHQPEPIAPQKAVSNLEQFASREAQRRGLTVKRRKLFPTIEGAVFQRARLEIAVSGNEQVLYQWLDRMQSPIDFRGITSLRINPKRDDRTQVDCLIRLEQWFIPKDRKGPAPKPAEQIAELRPLLEVDYYPMELVYQTVGSRPNEAIHFHRLDIVNEVDQEGVLLRAIRIQGVANELKSVTNFELNLKKSKELDSFTWDTPPPGGGDARWYFTFQATVDP